jgi:hypothetical protein
VAESRDCRPDPALGAGVRSNGCGSSTGRKGCAVRLGLRRRGLSWASVLSPDRRRSGLTLHATRVVRPDGIPRTAPRTAPGRVFRSDRNGRDEGSLPTMRFPPGRERPNSPGWSQSGWCTAPSDDGERHDPRHENVSYLGMRSAIHCGHQRLSDSSPPRSIVNGSSGAHSAKAGRAPGDLGRAALLSGERCPQRCPRPPTSPSWKTKEARLRAFPEWAVPGSNQRPPACKAGALPTELTALGL